jgi:hypothetical protein
MEDLKIAQKIEDMIEYGYVVLKNMPKSEHADTYQLRKAIYSAHPFSRGES